MTTKSTPPADCAAAVRLAIDEPSSTPGSRRGLKRDAARRLNANENPPELFQIIVECTGETQQRDLYGRLRREGLKLRLLVL